MITWNSSLSAKIIFNPKMWGFHFFTEGGPDGYGFQFWFLVVHLKYWSHKATNPINNEDIVKSYCCQADVVWDFKVTPLTEGSDIILVNADYKPFLLCSKCRKRVNDIGGKFIE